MNVDVKNDRKVVMVRVDSNRPIFIETDAKNFGEVFAAMNSQDQAEVLKAMCDAMAPHRLQWDYIAIELAAPEYAEVRATFAALVTLEQVEP